MSVGRWHWVWESGRPSLPGLDGMPCVCAVFNRRGRHVCVLDVFLSLAGRPPRFVALSVSSDVSITSTTPRAVVTPLGQKEPKFATGKNEFGRRWLRFSAPSDRHHVTIETPSRFGFGVAGTAAARGRRIREFCLILTPGAQVSEQLQAMTSTVVNEIGCGTITRLVDPMGRTVSIEAPESCVASTTELTNSEGQRVLFATPSSQITFEGSQHDCCQLTNGSWICYTQ